MSAFLEVENLRLKVGGFELPDFCLSIDEGECLALMGRSGCGKTTVMEAICGLRSESIVSGRVMIAGQDVTGLPAGSRGIGLVPQDLALFPTMTVREQLGFGPVVQGWSRGEVSERVEELAAGLGLEDLLERLPVGLSGGEARRVALGRALALRPRLLCLDEALSGLDEARHTEVLALIRGMVEREDVTALHITHSQEEAELIGDRVLVWGA